ncbi:hypothetical protein AB8E32_02210 [Marinomonas polaris]|uniref:hypothetical protein n=1 Tax=Marinomonas polaris TaxID=293552 RepID=UPI003515ADD9
MINKVLTFLALYPWIFLIVGSLCILIIYKKYSDIHVRGTSVTDPDGVGRQYDIMVNESLQRQRKLYIFIVCLFSVMATIFFFLQ